VQVFLFVRYGTWLIDLGCGAGVSFCHIRGVADYRRRRPASMAALS
jgi:hypothetical protein